MNLADELHLKALPKPGRPWFMTGYYHPDVDPEPRPLRELMMQALARVGAPIQEDGMYIRRTRSGRQVLVIKDEERTFAYIIRDTKDYGPGGMGVEMAVGIGHRI